MSALIRGVPCVLSTSWAAVVGAFHPPERPIDQPIIAVLIRSKFGRCGDRNAMQ